MINFTKMHGLGNDFVVIDAINQAFALTPKQIHDLSDRHYGIGFDQLLLVESPVSDNADFKYRIFNADGGEVSQCGNGARCFARFVRYAGLSDKDDICVDTNAGQLHLHIAENGLVTVNMGVPKHAPSQIPLLAEQEAKFYTVSVNDTEKAFGAVSLGNPHAVVQVNDLKTAPVVELGGVLERHPIFPERVNVGFMQIINRQHLKLRVFERGAGETLACGSGACAAAIIGIEQNLLEHEVFVELPGGDLKINWAGRNEPVFMTGSATWVFDGQISLEEPVTMPELSASQVARYLQQHPEFFNGHLDLLEQISIPHPSGNAVSLISKQLEIFRERHQDLENQLTTLIDIARDNDTAFLRMHKLTLALLDASNLQELLENLETVLTNYFYTDFFILRITRPDPGPNISNLFVAADADMFKPFAKELASDAPSCLRPSLIQARALFGDRAAEVKSCAIIPMAFTELEGLLAIGSNDENRFHQGLGNLFLTQMSMLIGTRLISLLQKN